MNKPLRHVSLVLAVLLLFLFGSTTYFQVIKAEELNSNGRNARTIYNEFGRPRGPIVVDGVAIASSTKVNNRYGLKREYARGPLYAPVTGYNSVVYGFGGMEKAANEELSGKADSLFYDRLMTVLSGHDPQGAQVELTINAKAQEAAYEALGDHRGAAVAIDPTTGAVLAMVSTPSYDPNALASHNSKDVQKAWKQLNDDPNKPMHNRAIAGNLYPPGSTSSSSWPQPRSIPAATLPNRRSPAPEAISCRTRQSPWRTTRGATHRPAARMMCRACNRLSSKAATPHSRCSACSLAKTL